MKKITVKKIGTKKPAAATVTKKKTSSVKITKTYVTFVLDQSGSMEVIRDATINNFNEQVDKINTDSKKIKTNVSLFTFNSDVQEVFFNKPSKTLQKLTRETYIPSSMTAMYDGVGEAIDKLLTLKDINKPNVASLLVIISDGEENSSRKFTSKDVAEKIQKLQETNRWTVSFMGANVDLSKVAQQLNIPILNTQSFNASVAGTKLAGGLTRSAIGGYYNSLSKGATSSTDFYSTPDDEDDKEPKVVITIE